jgi:membrane associated rhomboid family serine protease
MNEADRDDESHDAEPRERIAYTLDLATPHTFLTWSLFAANVAVFVAMAVRGASIVNPSSEHLIQWGAYYGPLVTHGQWWRLLTAAFVHIGIVHLLMNMYVLVIIGRFMERLFGHVGFFVLYMLSGLGGSVAGLMWHPAIIAAGASGAIFGLYGGLVGFLLVRRHSIPRETVVGLFKAALFFVVINTAYGLTRQNVDAAAHAGGFVTGVLAGWALALPNRALGRGARLAQSAAVAVIGVAMVAVLTARVPPVDDLIAELKRLDAVERQSVTAYAEALKKLQARSIKPGDFATTVETQVLPPWEQERERISKLKLDDPQRSIADRWVKHMALRAEAWRLIATGVRTDDQQLIKQARDKEAEAAAIARTVTEPDNERSPAAAPPGRPTIRRNDMTAANQPSTESSGTPPRGDAAPRLKVEAYRVAMRACASRNTLKSSQSPDRTAFDLSNATPIDIDVVWFSSDGSPTKHAVLHPGFTMTQATRTGHVWALATMDGKCIAAFNATTEPGIIRLH